MNKNIAFFISSISQGAGTERITSLVSNELVNSGYSVSIISIWNGKNPFFTLDERIKCISLLKSGKGISFHFLKIISKLSAIIKCYNIDILINVDVILALFTIPIKVWKSNLKIISWEHFNYKTNLGVRRRDWGRILSKRYADAIVTLTNQDKNFYNENLTREIPIWNIPNFIESEQIQVADIRKKNIIAVGRLTYQKGFDILLEIWKEVISQISDDNWKLRIVGNGEDKILLINQTKRLGITDRVEFIGAKKDVSNFYNNSSIYVMTSRFEGLPMVLIEALYHGLPIISFDCTTGPADVIESEVNGYLIPPKDKQAFVDRLVYLINHEELRLSMQSASLEKVKNFSNNSVMKKWKELFEII